MSECETVGPVQLVEIANDLDVANARIDGSNVDRLNADRLNADWDFALGKFR
ncbi:hypothetical protein PXK00_07850 [Phaeobacter sp. QD34_3]|uniref:hypothetical protein n=1 Tax=Phaeobacter sp. QD34_24 TaxID=3029980 RepID=UPI00237F7EE8|nr:hypothetical protein [Phaeobacter sp. QD34_24]MDE4133020.1 hypothetical protein [Phaeobacter sp. QD34_3]